jgi:predicted site-specific integrase-resolvase
MNEIQESGLKTKEKLQPTKYKVQKTNKMKKAILYARMAVKDLSQKPNRLLLQLDELSVYCQDNNILVEKMVADYGSGNSFDRKEFKELLQGLKSGEIKADLLLFEKNGKGIRILGSETSSDKG